MLQENDRGGRPRGLPSAGDAACVWHVLDAVLGTLREGRDTLEGAGLDELAEELRTSVEALEPAYAKAEEKLKALESRD